MWVQTGYGLGSRLGWDVRCRCSCAELLVLKDQLFGSGLLRFRRQCCDVAGFASDVRLQTCCDGGRAAVLEVVDQVGLVAAVDYGLDGFDTCAFWFEIVFWRIRCWKSI